MESPNPSDVYTGRYEGDILRQAAALNDIPCVLRIAIDHEKFIHALTDGIKEDITNMYPKHLPILHISAHGKEDGIELSCGQFIKWDALKKLVAPLNNMLKGALLLCISTCKGGNACQMAMVPYPGDLPFFAVVGNMSSPSWSVTAIAYATFYHHLAKGESVAGAVNAMKIASKNDKFLIIKAAEAKQSFLDKINKGLLSSTYRDRSDPHRPPLPHHAAYGSVLRDSADQAESDPGEHKPK